MKNKIFYLIFLSALFFMIGCSSDDDFDENKNFAYFGHWIGTYYGTRDSGSIDIDIREDGTIDGVFHSVNYEESFEVKGSINSSGRITATLGNIEGGAFIGNIQGNTGTGTWINTTTSPQSNGTWELRILHWGGED